MDKNISYDDIIYRIGYFRNKNNLSARETSLQLGFSDSFMELCNITPEEFFYYKPDNYEKDKELLQIIKSLSNENKDALIDIARRLK